MMKNLFRAATVGGMAAAIVTTACLVAASPALATGVTIHPDSCPANPSISSITRTTGFGMTTASSAQFPGPGTISGTLSTSADDTMTWNASGGVSFSLLIATASTDFGVSYASSTSHSTSWTYSKSVPAGKTGMIRILHKEDRLATTVIEMTPTCSPTTVTGYAYVPVSDTSNSSYCIWGDLQPFESSTFWQAGCSPSDF